jgi:hypothetical protein
MIGHVAAARQVSARIGTGQPTCWTGWITRTY